MFCAGFHDINSCRLDAGMTEQVRQFRDIFFEVVKCPRKQVPQVVGEHFTGRHLCLFTKGLHLRPNLFSGKPCAVSGEEHLAGDGLLFFGILQQLPAQLVGQQDGAYLALQGDFRFSKMEGLYGDILDL